MNNFIFLSARSPHHFRFIIGSHPAWPIQVSLYNEVITIQAFLHKNIFSSPFSCIFRSLYRISDQLIFSPSHCAPQNGSLNRHDCFRVIFHNPVNDILNCARVKALCAYSLFTHFPCPASWQQAHTWHNRARYRLAPDFFSRCHAAGRGNRGQKGFVLRPLISPSLHENQVRNLDQACRGPVNFIAVSLMAPSTNANAPHVSHRFPPHISVPSSLKSIWTAAHRRHVHHKYRKLVSKYRLNNRFGSCSRR